MQASQKKTGTPVAVLKAACPVICDSYDNALAESPIGQTKAELIARRGKWKTIHQLELAVFEYLD